MVKIFTQSINGGKGSATYGKNAQTVQSGRIADIQG